MAISEQLLAILVCPETRQALQLVEPNIVDRFNASIRAGNVSNRGEKPVEQEVSALLVRQDGEVFYLVRDGIPILLIDEGILAAQLEIN